MITVFLSASNKSCRRLADSRLLVFAAGIDDGEASLHRFDRLRGFVDFQQQRF